jgi:hypothetical protein
MCQQCQIFLYDFLLVPPHKDLSITKQIRVKNLQKILPDFVDWSLRLNRRVQQEDLDAALLTSSQIARRGRSLHEYECILNTSTSNFLRLRAPWISSEIDYMKLLLIGAGVIRGHLSYAVLRYSQEYLHYMIPRILLILRDLHDDHANPKGLYTDLGKLFGKPKLSDSDTCYDRDDDYQREILEEIDLDDLYT